MGWLFSLPGLAVLVKGFGMSGNSHFDSLILALELEGLSFFMQLAERKGPIRTKQLQLKLQKGPHLPFFPICLALINQVDLRKEKSCKHFQTNLSSITCYPKMPPKGRDGPSYWFNRPKERDCWIRVRNSAKGFQKG